LFHFVCIRCAAEMHEQDPVLLFRRGNSSPVPLPQIYGDGPRVLGLETCEQFRRDVPASARHWAIAGLPNTGTNALHILLRENCPIRGDFQVPWKKHSFLHKSEDLKELPANSSWDFLPLVLVKDPVQWFASTCRMMYFPVRLLKGSCPSPLNISAGVIETTRFANLVELWSRWHREYWETNRSRLMIRSEDLLFLPEETVNTICTCVGGTPKLGKDFGTLESDPKWGTGHDHVNNRSQSLKQFKYMRSVEEQRLTEDDRWLFRKEVDREILAYFRYPMLSSGGDLSSHRTRTSFTFAESWSLESGITPASAVVVVTGLLAAFRCARCRHRHSRA